MRHMIGFGVCEILILAMIVASLWSYKKEKSGSNCRRESGEIFGAIMAIQSFSEWSSTLQYSTIFLTLEIKKRINDTRL